MRTLYQVPCSCGKVFEVPKTRAGEPIVCECGNVVDIPPLRELTRNYSPVRRPDREEENLTLDSESGVRQRRRGTMFLALILAIIFGGMSVYFYWTRPYIPALTDCNVYEAWTLWQDMRPGIDAPLSRMESLRNIAIATYWRWIVLLTILAGVCILWALVILLAPVSKKKP